MDFTPDEVKQLERAAQNINLMNWKRRVVVIFKLLGENAALLRECNQLRVEKGLEPHKVHEVKA